MQHGSSKKELFRDQGGHVYRAEIRRDKNKQQADIGVELMSVKNENEKSDKRQIHERSDRVLGD